YHVGELQGPEAAAAPLRRREADDDEISGLLGFDLEPRVRAPGAIWGVGALGDDSLETERVHLREERLALALDVVERVHGSKLRECRHEDRLAGDQRQRAKIIVLESQQVEGEIRRR